jgi:glycosyltransferase involved in cell wall biosynthesis
VAALSSEGRAIAAGLCSLWYRCAEGTGARRVFPERERQATGRVMISIILCTYNRAQRLEQALKSLQKMASPVGSSWELIIVDNNSNDNTERVVQKFMNDSSVDVKYIIEKRQGVSHARNTGVRQASGDIIVFTDDDCIVDRYWIASILNEFKSDASIAGFGGRVELYNHIDRPVSIRVHKEKTVFSSTDKLFNLIIGCNMGFVRSVFDEIGMFDANFGAGSRFASAEDSDFLYRVYKKGFKIIYSPDVLVYHNHGRGNDAQIELLYRGYALGHGAFYCKYILMGDKEVCHLAYSEIVSLIRQIIKRFATGRSSAHHRLFLRSIILGFIYKFICMKIRNECLQ